MAVNSDKSVYFHKFERQENKNVILIYPINVDTLGLLPISYILGKPEGKRYLQSVRPKIIGLCSEVRWKLGKWKKARDGNLLL